MAARVDVNPGIITWAIRRAGRDPREFLEANPRVAEWVEGHRQPTVKQLEEFAKRVHLPFGYLFLDQPPEEKLQIPFFRTGAPPLKG